jgi:hypothetical protein
VLQIILTFVESLVKRCHAAYCHGMVGRRGFWWPYLWIELSAYGCSQATLDSKRGQDEHQCVDQGPHKGYPGRHLEVAGLIHAAEPIASQLPKTRRQLLAWHSQSAHNAARDDAFNARYHSIYNRRDPYDLPVPPLYHARPRSDDHVHGTEEDQRP